MSDNDTGRDRAMSENEPARDRAELEDLVARYADAVTRRDEVAWRETWSKDGVWHVLGQSVSGRDALVEHWHKLMGVLPFVMQVAASGTLRIQGDAGEGRWSVIELGKLGNGSGLMNLGLYTDTYQRDPAGWRFATRRFQPVYSGPPDLSAAAIPWDEALVGKGQA
jgi:hypothetical protein